MLKKNKNKKGTIFRNKRNYKRPGIGLSPVKWFKVINKKAKKNFRKDDLISMKILIFTSSRAEYGLLSNLVNFFEIKKN